MQTDPLFAVDLSDPAAPSLQGELIVPGFSNYLQPVGDGQVPVVTRINNVKFRHMLRPGDVLEIEVELTEVLQNAYFMTGKVSSGGKVAARLEFACTAATME